MTLADKYHCVSPMAHYKLRVCVFFPPKERFNSVRFALNFWESKILLRALWSRTPFTSPTYPFVLLFNDTFLTTDDVYFIPKKPLGD